MGTDFSFTTSGATIRGLQKPASASIGFAMLMGPNKAETAVHGCLITRVILGSFSNDDGDGKENVT